MWAEGWGGRAQTATYSTGYIQFLWHANKELAKPRFFCFKERLTPPAEGSVVQTKEGNVSSL